HVRRSRRLRGVWRLYTRLLVPAVRAIGSCGGAGVERFLRSSIRRFYAQRSLRGVEQRWRGAGIESVASAVLGLGVAVVTSGTRETSVARPRVVLAPAFYALPGGVWWRDVWTLLHPPYTAWHLSYVVLGAALAPTLYPQRLAGTVLAFFFALGIGVHALDELNGRPLRTRIPPRVLLALGALGIGAAVGLGMLAAIVV